MFSMCRSLTTIASGVRSKQAENKFEHDGFPGPARAEQDLHAAFGDAEADIPENDVVVEGEADPVEHNRRRYRNGA